MKKISKDHIGKLIALLIAVTIIFVGMSARVVAEANDVIDTKDKKSIGDLDFDGEITINDLALLKLHYIGTQLLDDDLLEVADMDKDERITVNDIARMKLVIIGLLELECDEPGEDITVEDTSFQGYSFEQITPENKKVTYSRINMTNEDMLEYGSTGSGSQWPVSLETSKSGDLMLLGIDVAGLYKSTDHGKTWEPANSGITARGVGMFAIDPYNSEHVLALGLSTRSSVGGIHVSYDGATTWDKTFAFATKGERYLWDGLEFDPTSYDEETKYTLDVYFSTAYKRDTDIRSSSTESPSVLSPLKENEVGLYKSSDGGQTFTLLKNDEKLADGIIRITDNGKLFIGNQYGLFLVNKETGDIEQTYLENVEEESCYAKGITGLDVVGNTIYAQTWDGIYTLEDDGTLTKITNDTYHSSKWPQFLEVSSSNPEHMIYQYRNDVNNYYVNNTAVSYDGGKTWQNGTLESKSVYFKTSGKSRERLFIIDPADDNNVITFAGDTLVRSEDGGLNFIQVCGISNTMQGGRFNFNYYNPDLLLFSAQDYTGSISTNGGETFSGLKISGKGNFYGGFAADEDTIFGFANKTWNGGTLTYTHDGGKTWTDTGLEATETPVVTYYSSLQSITEPNVLFATQYYSKDKGYTWEEMDGCTNVFTFNYTGEHELYGGDKDGNLVVSYDNGDTWKILNSKPFKSGSNITKTCIADLAYDHVNNYAYILLYTEDTNGSKVRRVYKYDITNDISKELTFPKDSERGYTNIKSIAVDPNSTGVIYIGGSGDYFSSSTGLVRSIDGGETWEVLTTANNPKYEAYATNQGGYEIGTVRVDPITGTVWIACGCYGYETFDPPYDASLLNHETPNRHTIKYVYNGKVVNEATVKNGCKHDYTYLTDGLKFIDWYTDEELENSFSNGSNVYNSMVLYAKMEPSEKLELYVSDELFKSIDLDKFDADDEDLIPEKDGYAFAGWYYDKDLTQTAELKDISGPTSLYAGWYKAEKNIFKPEEKDMGVYIAFADQKIQYTGLVSNEASVENRSIYENIDKNATYLISFKMDTRFRIGMAKDKFETYQKVENYYINENDDNGTVSADKYVYKVIESGDYNRMLIFYYTSTGTKDFMDIKNTFKIYKLENSNLVYYTETLEDDDEELNLTATKLGIGGGGMLHSPSISPFDSNTMMVTADMGGVYVSHDAGETWNRKNLKGTVHKTYFDPNREGVLYAGGSGLYRSTDNGETFELLFPREDDVIERVCKGESGTQYLYTKSGVYPTTKMVKDIIVNPRNSDNIFVLMYYGKEGEVYESKDNGETFTKLFEYTKQTSNSSYYTDYNQIVYQQETDTIYYSVEEGIYKYDRESNSVEQVYSSDARIMEVTAAYENGKTNLIVIEKTDELSECDTRVFYTSDFENITDITERIIKDLSNTFTHSTYGTVKFKWTFCHIDATSINNIYITQSSYATESSYPYRIDGVIKFDGEKSTWIYGLPFRDQMNLENRAWADGNYRCYGIKIDPNNDDTILFTTICGVYYSPDSDKIYQRYSKVVKEGNTTKYVTTGIDEQNTYGVEVDPFNKNNLLLLNTDLGLIRSEDNGATWERANSGVLSEWSNTIYDAEFDQKIEGVVYGAWSGRHDVPYSSGNETDEKYGGFAISYDGGKTWDCTYSSGLPKNAIPIEMSVVYPEDDEGERTIYLATFNEGFFVSYDSGKTFTSMNNGIDKVSYYENGVEKYKYILGIDIEAKDGRVFGLTARSAYNGKTQPGEVFEYINGKWEKIDLGGNVQIPRDIYYNDGTLYISATTIAVYDYRIDGVEFSNYGGGIYTYKDGKVTQIFDESISVTGVQIDSNGILYASDTNGNIYRKKPNGKYTKIYDSYHSISKGIQLVDDDVLYLATFGGGLLRLEGLKGEK